MRLKTPGYLIPKIRASYDTPEAFLQDSRDQEETGLRASYENHIKLG